MIKHYHIKASEHVNIYEAKTSLSKLVDRAMAGEEIVIARAGRPVAKLIAYQPQRAPRTLGKYAAQVWIAPDFDETPVDLLRLFEEGDV